MALSTVRTYFKDRMLEAVSDAVEHKDAIAFDNTSVNIKNKTFFIEYENNTNLETHGNRVSDEVTVRVIFLYKAYRYTQEKYDDLQDIMHDYKLRCSNIARYENGIKRVVGNSIIIEEIDESNDNILQCTCTFTVRYENEVI